MPRTKRKDKSRVVLRTGESQRADGTYHFSWTDANHKRRYVYTGTQQHEDEYEHQHNGGGDEKLNHRNTSLF